MKYVHTVSVIVPTEEVLDNKHCDFQECLWRGEAEFRVVLNIGELNHFHFKEINRLVLLSQVL